MNKYSPYWILNPLKNDIDIKNHGNWNFYTSKEVIDGISPVKDLGAKFYQMSHHHVSLYDHCLWIFNNSEFDSENRNKLARILKSVAESFCNSLLSQTGIIVTLENGDIIKQPATPIHYESIGGENLTNNKLITIINITESIYRKNLIEYLAIFEYLREIKKSSTFISELALWSFIEQHWIENINSKNRLAESLKKLSTKVYDRKEPVYVLFKDNLKKLIESTGGKKSNLSDLRNLLAHGIFYKQKDSWDDNQWNQYFEVHEFLNEMVLLGLEKEIIELKNK
ncbi:hypothetical protein [Zhouia amylolytica]|nr:hypothetical protein [Zhouia amylolytica]